MFLCEAGTVTVENMGLGGVTVRLSGMADGETTTDDTGQYSFTGLRAGTYSVEISGFDAGEVGFSSTSGAATVGVGESKVVSFDGTYLRTAGIQGQVSVEGEGLGGVTVTLVGEGEDRSETTNASGQYAFSKLKGGTYQVAISGFDPDDYEFETTSKTATIATGETANVPFEGTLLRTAGIAGRVSVEGMGLDGVEIALAGAAEAMTTTANGGQYSFAGLAEGTYVLTMTNPNADAYTFEETTATVVLADSESNITNFEGTHTRTASISGVLFIDEVDQDKMLTAGEPTIVEALAPLVAAGALDTEMLAGLLAQAKVVLRGPDLNTMTEVPIQADGTFTTGEALVAGSYQVELPANNEMVAAALAAAGVAFVGESSVVTVDAAGSATVNFPFRITMQTVATGARMGGGGHFGAPVAGVKLALYARADGTGMLGEATTGETGAASFSFARADDTSPGSEDGDNIVFVKVVEAGHPALVVSGNDFVEINYASTARLYAADAEKEVATLVNIAVGFDFWVKSNEMARDGDMGLGGWNTQVFMGDPTADDAMPLMVEVDGEMVNATMPTDDGEDNAADEGKSTFAYVVDPTMLPATFTVVTTEAGQPDQGEAWEQGEALTFTHTGLDLPPGADDDMLDLGPLRVTFTTQAVYVGVHRELDDRTGMTDFIGLGDGDGRPTGTAEGEIEVALMAADSRGRLRVLEYDHDADPETPDARAEATAGASGVVSFKNIPADMEITVVADEGSGRVVVPDSRASREIDAFGGQLDDYPDGTIVGAFGAGSGARPDMWLCPLQRQASDNPSEVCSTYGYKWATGTISGTIGGLRKGDKATVTLTPVNSNEAYADDLADDIEITGTGGATPYSFTGVADGRYMVTLEASAGSWGEAETKMISVMHDEENEAEDYTGDVNSGNNLEATDLRGVIRGRVANDSNTRPGLTSDESRAGVVVNLHAASAPIASGANKDRRTAGADVVATAETDGDGVFMFENLVVGKHYFVKPQGTDLYTAVRNGSTSIANEKSSDIVTHALTQAVTPPPAGSEPAIPTWDYNTSTAAVGATTGEANFVLLYKDGEIQGGVSDPSTRRAHSRAVVELHQCKTTSIPEDDATTTTHDESEYGQCATYTDVVEEASVDARGNWSKSGLREGIYEVVVDLPAGFEHVNKTGEAAHDGATDATPSVASSYFTQQLATLIGGRADDGTETFHIKDRNAGAGAAFTSLEIDGTECVAATTGIRCFDGTELQNNAHDDATISVELTASDGATILLSSSATNPSPRGTGTYSVAVDNGEATNVTLPTGARTFHVHIAAEDGYANNRTTNPDGSVRDPDSTPVENFTVRRDADVRVESVTIKWSGATLELDREALDLDPDGEDAPVTGAVDLGTITLTGVGTETALTSVSGTAMNSDFGSVTVTGSACPATRTAPTAASAALTDGTLSDHDGDAATPDQITVCFSIGDWKSATDLNNENGHQYQAVLRRPAS